MFGDDPTLFEFALLAARWQRPVAVLADGPEAQRLRALRDTLRREGVVLSPFFAIGRVEAAHLLAEFDHQQRVETRADALHQLGLVQDDLPPPVARALTATRAFLDLARGA